MAVEEPESAGVAEWVVTFGDMMSLLLTFFIMLFSMSEIQQEEKFQAMLEAMRRTFGHDMSIVASVPGPSPPMNSQLEKMASLGRAMRANTMKGGDKVKAPVGDEPRVRTIRKGEDPTVGGVVYFSEGSAELTDEAKHALQVTAGQIGGKLQKIEIRGHTSNRPLVQGSPYRSHWDLAYARCVKVMDFLVNHLGINPRRIRLSVAAENEPVHIGADPLLRKENPRVEVLMLNELTRDLEGTPEERARKYHGAEQP